jgi:hypothetical protein
MLFRTLVLIIASSSRCSVFAMMGELLTTLLATSSISFLPTIANGTGTGAIADK